MEISLIDLHKSLSSPSLDRVKLLNEIASDYPQATSFASGSPAKTNYNVEDFIRYIDSYIKDVCETRSISRTDAYSLIGNYSSSKGIILDHIKKMLLVDEGIEVSSNSIVVTSGAQEAITLSLHALFSKDLETLLVVSPFYSGVKGATDILSIDTAYVEESEDGVDINSLMEEISKLKEKGRIPKAIYCTPNHSNPSGICMTESNRRDFLRICRDNRILIIEDNTYGAIGWELRPPSLKQMHGSDHVLHIGSFSKSAFPGLRIGYVVADQRVTYGKGETLLADCIAKIKTMTSNNTSHVSQAMVAGYLVENGYSVKPLLRGKISAYRRNMRVLIQCLEDKLSHIEGVSWTVPGGGFFVILTVPFEVTEDDVFVSATNHGVIWLPINFFKVDGSSPNKIRLAFGNVTTEEIISGVNRLCNFFETFYERKAIAS